MDKKLKELANKLDDLANSFVPSTVKIKDNQIIVLCANDKKFIIEFVKNAFCIKVETYDTNGNDLEINYNCSEKDVLKCVTMNMIKYEYIYNTAIDIARYSSVVIDITCAPIDNNNYYKMIIDIQVKLQGKRDLNINEKETYKILNKQIEIHRNDIQKTLKEYFKNTDLKPYFYSDTIRLKGIGTLK